MPFLSQVELSTEDKIHFVAIGDWGTGLGHQKEVTTALGEFCSHKKLLFFYFSVIVIRYLSNSSQTAMLSRWQLHWESFASTTDATSSSPPGTTCT